MKISLLLTAAILLGACNTKKPATTAKQTVNFDSLAITPPMGWNSYDCFGSAVNEKKLGWTGNWMFAIYGQKRT